MSEHKNVDFVFGSKFYIKVFKQKMNTIISVFSCVIKTSLLLNTMEFKGETYFVLFIITIIVVPFGPIKRQ